MSHSGIHLILEQFHNLVLTYLIVLIASVGGNGETGRHGNTDVVHLGQVGTLTAQHFSHLGITFGLSVSKGINSFLTHNVIKCLI